jgi:hypothetical protein
VSTPTAVHAPPVPGKLFEQVIVTAAARQGATAIAAKLAELRGQFDAQHADLIRLAEQSKNLVAVEEAELRRLALMAYEETGSKTPAPGVSIRIIKAIAYDAGRALLWAREFGLALTVDTKAFERIATASPIQPGDPLAFVQVTDQPQATLAKDLGAALQAAP